MLPYRYISAASCRVWPFFILLVMLNASASAQISPDDVRVEIDLMPNLTKAQTLSLATLGVDTKGSGSRIMNLIIENTTDKEVTDLYLYINVSASGVGTITQLDQLQWRPFSLQPGQLISADNNDLQTGLPGISEKILLNGDLTPAGENFINRLEGSTTLPDLLYTVEIRVYHGHNRQNGGTLIAESSVALPVEGIFTDIGFDLDSPGDVIGAPLERLVSNRPVFRWQGSSTQSYRIIIVEAVQGQTAQGLIQAAMDTEPVIGGASAGELLEFEMTDALVESNNFNYPISMVQSLQQGTRYYWQVFANTITPISTEYQPSPIWQFGIQKSGIELSEMDNELLELISRFLPDQHHALILNGYTVESADINGRTVSGVQLLTEIEKFIDDLESGSIKMVE